MLYLLASGQAHDRQEVAPPGGGPSPAVGRWRALYAASGLDALLETHIPAGKSVSLAPDVLARLEQGLSRPEGFASCEALRQWLARTHGVPINYRTLYTLVRTRSRPKLKVPRPSHTKQP